MITSLGYGTYMLFGALMIIMGFWALFFIPETKNRTLEELDEIFDSPNPVKTSIARKRLGFDAYGEVVNIEDM